jgi:hypothetical protein
MPGGWISSKQTCVLDLFPRHSLHALSHTQVVERTKQMLAKAAPNEGVWRPFKAEDSLLAFLRNL